MPFCSNCGSEYQEGSKFCQSCGHKLDSIPIAAQKSKAERWMGKYTYSGVIGSLRRPVSFSAVLIFDGDKLSGNIEEHNTFDVNLGMVILKT